MFLVDAAQSAGQVPIDLRRTPIDLLGLSGRKFLFGPSGTDVLHVSPRAAPGRAPGARGIPAARARTTTRTIPRACPTVWRAARLTSWGSPAWTPGSPGSPAAAPTASTASAPGRRVGRWIPD
ncbi:MAG TPA: aminotransferase class V-fold PLP-dependent enzyme, partial [Isosphaeraceae bacterium]